MNVDYTLRKGVCQERKNKRFLNNYTENLSVDIMKINAYDLLKKIGPLRILLFTLALVLIVFAPEAGAPRAREGIAVITNLIFPTVAPMVFMGLLLDALMSWVKQIDLSGEDKKRFRILSYINLLFALALLIRWLPFLLSLGRLGNA